MVVRRLKRGVEGTNRMVLGVAKGTTPEVRADGMAAAAAAAPLVGRRDSRWWRGKMVIATESRTQ